MSAITAPERIWAKVRGAMQSFPSLDSYVIGSFEARPDDAATEYIRADLVPSWNRDMSAAPRDGNRVGRTAKSHWIAFMKGAPMTDTETLRSLLARVEATEGPDRELDAEIAAAIGGYVYEKRGADRKEWFYPFAGSHYGQRDMLSLDRFTTSIDAIVTLIERMLPESFYFLGKGRVGPDEL